ncbi:MAG: inorganic phosphate transporter [Isosphaeraceae bacterium]
MYLPLLDGEVSAGTLLFLLLALGIALSFEFVNGFHDTANAVATVIYTRSLKPHKAVAWSGFCNFLGVYLGGTAVAFSIVNLLPVEALVSGGQGSGLAMVLALLVAAISWNLGTWYLAIPASSSHTLIGSILGVGLANAALRGQSLWSGVNWTKVMEVGASLMISPLIGFGCAGALLLVFRWLARHPRLHEPASQSDAPPLWVRGTLVATCTGVSLAHGSNDGQKGIGLLMLILIGFLPAQYALNPQHDPAAVARVVAADESLLALLERHAAETDRSELLQCLSQVPKILEGRASLNDVPQSERWPLRTALIRIDKALERLEKDPPDSLSVSELHQIHSARRTLSGAIYYAPAWVLMAVAMALGVGTMIGWKRIVVTVGERIGKSHLSYAQGAAAEIVAAGTITLADVGGLPVSTTHVLASGIAGTMAANRSGLQIQTIRVIALAWLLTMPASMALGAGLFALLRLVL